jgi:hypothetical protein
VSIGQRQWAPAPGGVTVKSDPMRPACTWATVAEDLCDAVRGKSGERPAVRGAHSEAVGSATGRRRGMIG